MVESWDEFPADLKDAVVDITKLEKEAKKADHADAIKLVTLAKQKLGNLVALTKGRKIDQAEAIKPVIVKAYNAAVELLEEGEGAEEEETEQPFEIVYEAKKSLFDAKCQKTIEEASVQGASYGTPGPTALHRIARHHHVTNKDGVAFRFDVKARKLYVLGYGKKHNRNTGRGDSGYDWES